LPYAHTWVKWMKSRVIQCQLIDCNRYLGGCPASRQQTRRGTGYPHVKEIGGMSIPQSFYELIQLFLESDCIHIFSKHTWADGMDSLKFYSGPRCLNPSMPCRRATPEMALWPFQRLPARRVGNLRPSSTPLDTPRSPPLHPDAIGSHRSSQCPPQRSSLVLFLFIVAVALFLSLFLLQGFFPLLFVFCFCVAFVEVRV
jgi:hypothetical protein